MEKKYQRPPLAGSRDREIPLITDRRLLVGQPRTGRYTMAAIAERRELRDVLRTIRELIGLAQQP